MDTATTERVHPAFVEIIKQLTSDEAKLLKRVADLAQKGVFNFPLIDLRRRTKGESGSLQLLRNFTTLDDEAGCGHISAEKLSSYIDNLCRLEICTIPPNRALTHKELYEPLKTHKLIMEARTDIEAAGFEFLFDEKMMVLTSFGEYFINACVIDKTPEPTAKMLAT